MSTVSARPLQSLFEPPLASAEELRAALAVAERCRRDVVDGFSTDRIVAALAGAAAAWLRPEEPLRRFAVEEVSRATGLHPDMVATGIDFIFSAVTVAALERLAKAEGTRGPRAVFYSLAGNVPGQGVPAVARSLLARSIAIVRDSGRQPVITAAFRETLRRYEPALAAIILPVEWSHGSGAAGLERAVVAAADKVELFGSDRTVSDLSARYRASGPVACDLHGARVSAGLVLPGADVARAARGFAVDVAMYEGRGCLTPHVILVEGTAARASELADALARELARYEARWPRSRGSVEEERDRRRFIDDAEMRALGVPADRVATERCLLGSSGTWCVRQTQESTIGLGPGLRCVRVAHVESRGAAIAALRAATPSLAGIGVAGATMPQRVSDAEDTALTTELRSAGATLVCPAGRMQAPPIDWRPECSPERGSR